MLRLDSLCKKKKNTSAYMKDYGKFKKVYTNLVWRNRAAKEHEKMWLKEEFEV